MPLRQVYQYTKSGATEAWTEITEGDFYWNVGESENEFITKLGFNPADFFYNNPLHLMNSEEVHNKLMRMAIFVDKPFVPTITNDIEALVYIRIREYEQGVFFLCTKLGDLIFLIPQISEGTRMFFQKYET